ncbi:MAG: DegT/DnrJ/EryC1/StrS family aminotransferase [Chloroflexi bacterium]|nr:DegT/DnrJ/EryC1/StrS family aminotransferase [Chloroflexota bacterium]
MIPFNDLRAQYLAIKSEIDAAVARTLDSGWYILGQEVAAFEQEFAAYLANPQPANGVEAPGATGELAPAALGCVAVNSGTDALQLALMACDVGQGDEVITVAHTAVATAAAISLTGATPIFVDVDPITYTMAPSALEMAITPRTKAIIPVHLYGHPAALQPILALARRHHLRVIEDCAQAHGARYQGQTLGTLGDLGCFSFYPTKNLGALGDGGAVVSHDRHLLDRVRLLREYGWTPQARYVSQVQGMNSRLDELQAAILRVKLHHLDEWNQTRRTLALHYGQSLPATVRKPVERSDSYHVYHLYVVQTPHRDKLRTRLQAAGIGTAIHYPVPIHQQPAYAPLANYSGPANALNETEHLAQTILSLPLHPMLTSDEIEQIAVAVATALAT